MMLYVYGIDADAAILYPIFHLLCINNLICRTLTIYNSRLADWSRSNRDCQKKFRFADNYFRSGLTSDGFLAKKLPLIPDEETNLDLEAAGGRGHAGEKANKFVNIFNRMVLYFL